MNAIVSAWASLIVPWSALALVLLVVAWIAVKLDRSGAASTRHNVWLVALVASALVPLWTPLVRLLPSSPIASEASVVEELVQDVMGAEIAEAPPMNGEPHPAQGTKTSWLWIGAFSIWTSGLLFGLLRVIGAHWRMSRIGRKASSIPLTVAGEPVRRSSDVDGPTLIGVWRPQILLPLEIEAWTSDEERSLILRHEFAHLQRRDHWVSLFHGLLEAVFFFHPMVRYAGRQLRIERELACDAMALGSGSPSHYAELILKVAEHGVLRRESATLAFNSSRNILERRLGMILKERKHQSWIGWRIVSMTGVSAALAVVGWLAVSRTIVAEPAPLPQVVVQRAEARPVTVVAEATGREAKQGTVQQAGALAQLTGTVSDPSGARLPGVTVILKGSTVERRTLTQIDGTFQFADVPTDTYTIEAGLPGFDGYVANVTLGRGATQRRVVLAVRSSAMALTVSASRMPPKPIGTVPSGPSPVRIGGNIAEASLINRVAPVYPAAAQAAGIEGKVSLQVIIMKDGSSAVLRVLSDDAVDPELAKAAVEAVNQWKYKPFLLNGEPIVVESLVTILFRLEN